MAQKFTACEIKYSKKRGCFVLSLEFEEGAWKGAQSGAEIHEVNGFLVQMGWGFVKPVAVYTNFDQMIETLKNAYGVDPVVINCR
jgi:hypothetical protein